MRGLAMLSLAALAALGLIWISQQRLIYFPTQTVPDAATVQLGIEEVTYPTEDGLSLAAWFVPAAGEERSLPASRPYIENRSRSG
jgi:hypothetical protein